MIRKLAVVVALWSLSTAAWAQESSGFGLDLSDDAQKKTDTAPPKGKTETSPPPSPGVEAEAPPAPAAEPVMTEREITQDDRVKSVQRKVYLLAHRVEITPMITLSLNDPLYVKWGGALRAAYHIADTIAVSVRGTYIDTVPTDDVRIAKATFQSRIFFSQPNWSVMADVEWSPLYGKITILNSILHFDAYLLGGLGVVNTIASSPDSAPPKLGADMGIGLRFVVKDFIAVTAAVINTAYVDQPLGTTKGAVQNILTLNAGISFFIPFRSTGREAE